ncbi:MAG: OmpP1/FadL family transporter, partial [Myxococcaceae bacterium]
MRAVAVLFLCLSPATLAGSTFDIHGFGPRGVSMVGALTADAHDYSAVFYNPALLASRTELNFGVGFTYMKPMTEVKSKDPGRELDCTYCQPEDVAGVSAGFLFPLAGKVQNRVALGVGIYVPAGRLVRAFAADPNRPSWYMYQGSPERLAAFLGMGVRIIDELRLGVGFQIIANLLGNGADMQVDLFSKDVRMRELDAHLASRAGLTAGISFIPRSWLRFGLSYRGPVALDYRIPAHIDLTGVGVLNFTISGVAHYTPHTITGGVALDLTPQLTVTLDGTYELWSLAPSPFVQLDVDLSGETLKALGLDSALD